jgi:hypothetical protein
MFVRLWIAAATLLGASFASSDGDDVVKRSSASDILSDIENAVTCSSCEVRQVSELRASPKCTNC